jgi:GAF domain-containing protein
MTHLNPDRLADRALGIDDPLTAAEEKHLDSCAECRDELAELSRIAELGRNPERVAPQLVPTEAMWQSIQVQLASQTPATDLHESLARVVHADRELADVLTEITGIARRAMPSIEAASVTLIRGEKPFTAAFDGQMALDADELQYERGYGPCMDAGRAGQILLVDDMRSDQRWPDYAQHAAAHGVLSSLSVPLPFQGATIGALNTYAGRPQFLDDNDLEIAEEVAAWVGVAVGNAEAAARTIEDPNHLRTAMMSRAVIEQAKGILMERHKIKEDEAYTILTHASQRTNTKLRDVAAELVQTGAVPSRDLR